MVEVTGEDHFPFVGDTELVLEEIEESLTGTRGSPNLDRVLSTVLFTDIVDSTVQGLRTRRPPLGRIARLV